MNKKCVLGVGLLALSVGFGAGSTAFAKAHDQGVADGTRIDPSQLRGGAVAGVNVPGVGPQSDGSFAGVAADLDADLNYGDIVQRQVAEGTRRVVPVVNGRN